MKAVREVTALFAEPPELENTIGERTYQIRNETEVWPLHYLHILAEVGLLLKTRPALIIVSVKRPSIPRTR